MGSKLLYSLPALALALLALVLAIVGLSQDSKPQQADTVKTDNARQKADEYRYWVITQPLKEGDVLSQDKVSVVSSPTPIPDAVKADQTIEGRPLERYARPGELVTKDFFESGGSLPSSLPEGRRALAIPIDNVVGAGGLLQPGDSVDVVSAFRHSEAKKGAAAVVLLHAIPVLAVRGSLSRESGKEQQNRSRNDTVVLSVPEDKVPALMLASSEGKIRLAVVARDKPRPNGDATPAKTQTDSVARNDEDNNKATKPFYFDDFFPAEPKKAAPAAPRRPRGHRVQVFEGAETRSTYVQ